MNPQKNPTPNTEQIGLRVKELREGLGISQAELGSQLGGRTQGNIAQIEQGLRKIDIETLVQIADFFKIGLEYFFDDQWKVSRKKDQPVLLIDGLDLRQAFDQYIEETPYEDLRNTEEVRLKAIANPEGTSRAMAQFAEHEQIYYSYRPTPKEWHHLERKIARRSGAFRSITDVINALELVRKSGVLK